MQFRSDLSTSADTTAVSIPPMLPFHSSFVAFFPILHRDGQNPRRQTHKNDDDERGRKDFVCHIIRQVRQKHVQISFLNRLFQLLCDLAFGGHFGGRDGGLDEV